MSSTPSPGALEGLRVLDLSRILAGPYCTQMLADHGAEVIKVEPPGGDDTRQWGPPFIEPGMSAYFAGVNRNKTTMSLDLRSDDGQEVLDRLLRESDVLVENFKAGTLERWGLSDAEIAHRYPRLIHARITGFGVTGPMGGTPGYDAILQAYGGLMSINGEGDGPPLRIGVPIVDMVTGVFLMSGILLAINERHRSGRGQLVDCALLDTAVSLLHPHSGSWLADGKVPERTGSAHPTIAPYDTFEAADGPIFVAVGNDRQFAHLCRVLGVPEIVTDPRFVRNADRIFHREELQACLAPLIGARGRVELGRCLDEYGVPSSAVHDLDEVMTDPQVLHRQMVVEHDGYRGVGVPVKLTRTPASIRSAPTAYDHDTVATLVGLGYSDDDIRRIRGIDHRADAMRSDEASSTSTS